VKIKEHQILSEEFFTKFIEISGGYLPSETFENLTVLLQSEISNHYFPRSSESNLLRIISAMYDKYSFLTDCIKYPHYVEIIVSICANSTYLTDILVRNPEYFYWIVNPSNLEPKLNFEDFEKSVNSSLSFYKTFSSKVNFFRTLKRKEILRIGLKDILGLASLEDTTEELSTLAKVITAKLFELSLEEIKSKHQIKNISSSYCIVGLGKLGGNELNYSSDIDLIVFYDEGQTIKNKNYSELLTEVIYLFIESASSITSSGFIFRVDLRLRPDGRNSPLCRSINEYLSYYESRGEDWERQMLIKAGFIGGNLNLYNQFINYLSPFIFPSSFSTSPTEQIKKLKNNIERSLGDEENIKLLPGGIRDIEFSIQALQLINGGRLKELRTGNTLKSIDVLEENKLLTNSEADILKNAYRIYRKIEHYLQLMNDKRTHTIPADNEMISKISTYLGFDEPKKFKEALKVNRENVSKIYQSIIGKEIKVKEKRDISEINFENKKKALQDFTFLREGKGLLGQKEFDERTISVFQDIEPAIINYLKNAIDPDRTLQNFVRIIKSSSFPFIWYKELSDNKFLESLLTICEYSQRSIDMFAEDNEITELLFNRKVFVIIHPKAFNQYSLKRITFTLTVQFILGIIDHEDLSKNLSAFYSQEIIRVFNNFLQKKYPSLEYFLAGLGSFGSEEITFNSDIDLIFVVNNLKAIPNAEKVFQGLLSQIRKTLSPIEVDCRLRPEGKSSILVWDIKNYDLYIQKRLRIWELQAFTKISLICGSVNLFHAFLELLKTRLKTEKSSTIANEIKEMRRKLYPANLGSKMSMLNLKKSPGGLVDPEFVLQYLALLSINNFSKIVGKGVKIIAKLSGNNISLSDSETLLKNYSFLKRLDFLNQVVFNATTSILPSDKKKLNMFSRKMNFDSLEAFKFNLNEVMKSNKNLFQKYLTKN
jgi:[glutamine synthetase] adenylyltransferase / [glutamine synthetase]-adenylyl-L-tyrosine phosphorylase